MSWSALVSLLTSSSQKDGGDSVAECSGSDKALGVAEQSTDRVSRSGDGLTELPCPSVVCDDVGMLDMRRQSTKAISGIAENEEPHCREARYREAWYRDTKDAVD